MGIDERELSVIARYRTKKAHGDEVAELLVRHSAAARQEPGCLQFDVLRSREDGDVFVLLERYIGEQAFADHRTSPHFKRLIENGVVPLLEQRTWSRYDVLSGQ